MTELLYDAVPGPALANKTPAPSPKVPLSVIRLSWMMLLKTPATDGCGLPLASRALPLWLGTVIPQSKRFFVTVLPSTTLSCVGPTSSESRIPPELPLTKLSLTSDQATPPAKWIPSPQSPGIWPLAAHWKYGEAGGTPPPRSFLTTLL